jgi:hypothetical protein
MGNGRTTRGKWTCYTAVIYDRHYRYFSLSLSIFRA